MRRARIKYLGSLHHTLNRGHSGEKIFSRSEFKKTFIQMMTEKSKNLHIRIFAFCVMDNHFHIVCENTSGRISDFFKQLAGQYGIYYRNNHGGKGYVFQNRYKSFIIQDEGYLMSVISYVLLNPVRIGFVDNFMDYPWSSASYYFSNSKDGLYGIQWVEEIYGTQQNFVNQINQSFNKKLPIINTKIGPIIGGEDSSYKILNCFDRRKAGMSPERKRNDDIFFQPVKKVNQEFERKYKLKIDEIDPVTIRGKRLRGELLVYLRDLSGLKYKEIIKFDIFSDLRVGSLGKLYRDSKSRINQGKTK